MNSAELELLYIEAVTNSEALQAELVKSKDIIRKLELKIADEMDKSSELKKKIGEKEKSIDALNGDILTANNALEDAKDISVFVSKLKKLANANLNISRDRLEDYQQLLNSHIDEALHKHSIRIAPKKVDFEDAKKIVEQFNFLGHSDDPFSNTRKESFQIELDADAKQFHFIVELLGCTERMSSTTLEDMRNPVDAMLALDEMYEKFRGNVADMLIYDFGEKVVRANKESEKESEFAAKLARNWLERNSNFWTSGVEEFDEDEDEVVSVTAIEALERQHKRSRSKTNNKRILDGADYVKNLAEGLADGHVDMSEVTNLLEEYVHVMHSDLHENEQRRIFEMLLWTLQVEFDTIKANDINTSYERNP